MDHAVWTFETYRYDLPAQPWERWESLGGWAQMGVYSRYIKNLDDFGIWTYGSDNRRWNRYYGSPGWGWNSSGWFN